MSDTSTSQTNVRFDSSTPSGDDERHSLQTYVSDMLALERHIAAPIARQSDMDDLAKYGDAATIVAQIKAVNQRHIDALERCLNQLGGHPASGVKAAWSSLLGAGAAAVNTVRKTKISKALRDDHTALSLATISYTMLHATALGLGDSATAELAKTHLSDLSPIIISISNAMPAIVLQELRDDGENVVISAAELARQSVRSAWSQGDSGVSGTTGL